MSSCLACGKTAGGIPAFFKLSILSSKIILPSLAKPIDDKTRTRTPATNHPRIIYFFTALLGWVWHLLESANGNAIFPWHLPHHFPSAMPAIVILFWPFAGRNMAGWQTSHLSHHVCI